MSESWWFLTVLNDPERWMAEPQKNTCIKLVAAFVWETQVPSLGWEDPLEKEMATHTSILAWKIPWAEERGRLQFMGSQRVGHHWATSLSLSLVAQMVKSLPAVWEIRVWSLGREDPLEKAMATRSSIHAWRIPWTEEPGRLQSVGLQRVRHDWVTSLSLSLVAQLVMGL